MAKKINKIKCPCCGYYTFNIFDSEEDCLYDYCEVCGWMYDPIAHKYPNRKIGGNHISLNNAIENYKTILKAKPWFEHVREPKDNEKSP